MTANNSALRVTADLLCLWAFCGKPACRRARACKRDARDCITRWSPLVPEAARCGVLAVAEAGRCGIGDAEMRAEAGAEIAALEAWIGQVNASASASVFPSPRVCAESVGVRGS